MVTFYIIAAVLVVLIIFLSYIISNLLRKVEKYEDITIDQTQYLQSISKIVTASQIKIKELDTKGHFQADDELGEFFKALQMIQEELNKYMLPENYGEKTS